MKHKTLSSFFQRIYLLLFTFFFCASFGRPAAAVGLDRLEIPDNPVPEAWYRITPEGAVTADGSPWHGMFKKGTEENKILVWFYGGGMSLNGDMAAHPNSYYGSRLGHDGAERRGIGSASPLNPFRTWTVLSIPYATGDLHLGTGDYSYTALNGEQKTLFHHGYSNFRSFMEKAMQYVDQPETVLIAGYSAGGFGAAMLADELLTEFFPEAENATIYLESSLLLRNDWKEIAENIWHVPEHMTDCIQTDNLTLDALKQVADRHPSARILFSSSWRDYILSAFQNYFETGRMEFLSSAGDVYQETLKAFVEELQMLPHTAVFLWKEYPLVADLTGHVYMDTDTFFLYKLDRISTLADWLFNAVNGILQSISV